jgi:hypothetical protein
MLTWNRGAQCPPTGTGAYGDDFPDVDDEPLSPLGDGEEAGGVGVEAGVGGVEEPSLVGELPLSEPDPELPEPSELSDFEAEESPTGAFDAPEVRLSVL